MKRYSFLLFVFAIVCITACNKCGEEKAQPQVLVEKPEMINEEVSKLLTEKLKDIDSTKTIVILKDSLITTQLLNAFYIQNKFSVTWTDKGLLNKQGDTLFSILKNAGEYGLIPSDYNLTNIDQLLKTKQDSATKKFDALKICEADLLLTDAYIKFLVHVSKGRLNADSLTLEWHPEKLDTNIVQLVNFAIKQNKIYETIDSLEPRNDQYKRIKLALKTFKNDYKDCEWDSLASRESDSTTFNERIKKRLIASHDYFDEFTGSDSIKLIKSIKNFQCRHNLTEDGKVGKLTFKAMQATKEDNIRQLEMNLERWRWYEAPKGRQYVWVNIPKFEMKVIEKDTLVMKSRVITGAPDHQTPLLKSTIRYFLIYPYWTVPFSIATKEILPILKRDTSYLRRKHFEVLGAGNTPIDPSTIKWKRYSKTYFPWKLRQQIGDDNSLGILKFNFDNKYGVYMHDTDNRRLFGREMRALSHGCVRLDKFFDFAKFLVRDDSVKYPVDSLKADLGREQQKYVYAKRPITIYINYFTNEVDEYNEIHFFIDVYKRDEKMLRSIKKEKKKS